MKKIIIAFVVLLISACGISQPYFQATLLNTGNKLTVKIKPVGGDIVGKRFSAMEFFVRYPNTSPAFTIGTPTVDPAFTGINFTVKGPDIYGSETGFTNYVFEWIGGATFVPASPTTYTNNTEYTVFSADLLGAANVTDIELVHNTFQNPTYINISDNSGNSLSCLDNLGTTIGNAFYGPGFNIGPAPLGGNNHRLPLSNVPIPVKFLAFTALKSNNDAMLKWDVANEDGNTDRYELERSFNGTDFSLFTSVTRNISGTASNSYTATDAEIASRVRNGGIVYYRVKQVDKDGHFVYSDIKNIRFTGVKGFSVSVFPNPVKEFATVNFDLEKSSEVTIIITDAAGKELEKISLEGSLGGNTRKINMNAFTAGTYLLKIKAGEDTKVISIVKAK